MYSSMSFGTNSPGLGFPARATPQIVEPKVKFDETRHAMSQMRNSDSLFVPFSLDACLGMFVFDCRIGSSGNAENRSSEVLPTSAKYLYLRRSAHTLKVKNVMYLPDSDGVFDMSVLNVSIRKSLVCKFFITMHLHLTEMNASEANIVGGYFHDLIRDQSERIYQLVPRSIWVGHERTSIIPMIDSFLSSALVVPSVVGISEFMRRYPCMTNGQFIMAMIFENVKKNSSLPKLNIRLIMLLLSRLSLASDSDLISLMSEAFKWIVIGTCNSCLEKVLYFNSNLTSYMYDLDGYGNENVRPFMLKNVRLGFTVLDTCNPSTYRLNQIPRLEHSAMVKISSSDRATVLVKDYSSDLSHENGDELEEFISHTISASHCIPIKVFMDTTISAIRGTRCGDPNVILRWFKDVITRNGSLEIITEFMTHLVICFELMPSLRNCFKNMFIIFYFGTIPDYMWVNLEKTCSYDQICSVLINLSAYDHEGILRYCFDPKVTFVHVQNFLNKEYRINQLLSLCNDL